MSVRARLGSLRATFAQALARVEVSPGFPKELQPYLQKEAETLLREKKINAMPDWKKALRPDLWAKYLPDKN